MSSMDPASALQELEELAGKLGIIVSYETFTGEGMGSGGLCKVKGTYRVLIDRRCSSSERLAILAGALSRFDLEAHYLSPGLREIVKLHASSKRQ